MRASTVLGRAAVILAVAAVALTPRAAFAAGAFWSGSTPSPYGVHAFAVSPGFASDRTVFAGAVGGGVYKSSDSGAHWTRSSNGLGEWVYVDALAVSSGFRTDRTLFTVARAVWGGSWVLKSTDAGASWQPTTLGSTRVGGSVDRVPGPAMVISPAYPTDRTLFVSAGGEGDTPIYRSTDGGQSWTRLSPPWGGAYVYQMAISPDFAADRTVFVTTGGLGVWRSTNAGASWSRLTSLSDDNVWAMAVSPDFARDRTIVAGEFRSTDGGASWSRVNGIPHTPVEPAVVSVGFSPDFATDRTVYAGTRGAGAYRSTDGGSTWVPMGLGTAEVFAVAGTPRTTVPAQVLAGDETGRISRYATDPGSWDPRLEKPVVVLVNGWLNNGDGVMGPLKDLLQAEVRAGRIERVLIAPSNQGATMRTMIDSIGDLDEQVSRFANWMALYEDFRTHPVVIIGHSYGGLIARGLVSASADSRLRQTDLKDHMEVLSNIKGVVQLGSPNEGSALAEALNDPRCDVEIRATMHFTDKKESKATKSLAPKAMQAWNARNAVSRVPIQRGAGQYTPAALDECITFTKPNESWPGNVYVYNLAPDPAVAVTAYHALEKLHAVLGKQVSDGNVTERSAVSKDEYFAGGGWITYPHLLHSPGVPGDKLVEEQWPRYGSIWDTTPLAVRDMHRHKAVVPADDRNAVYDDILWAIRNPGKRWGNGPDRDRTGAASARPARPMAVTAEQGSLQLVPRDLTVAAGGSVSLDVRLGQGVFSLLLTSAEATPLVSLQAPAASAEGTPTHYRLDDGTFVTRFDGRSAGAGTRTLSVSMAGSGGGDVTVTGSAETGPGLFLDVLTDVPTVGRAVVLEARVESAGVALTDVAFRVDVGSDAERVSVAMRDDGVAPDAAAHDGRFTGEALLSGSAGVLYATAEATGGGLERYVRTEFPAGDSTWARISRAAEVTTEAAAVGAVGRLGIGVPLAVATEGTYTVVCDIADARGLVTQAAASAFLPSESTTLVAWTAGRELADIAAGPLDVRRIQLLREIDERPISVDETRGPVTQRFEPTDFANFSLDLTPLFSSPTTTAAPAFRGTATFTGGAVEGVEYSLDGGGTWAPAEADDGSFDGPLEPYRIAFEAGDGLHGMLVRSRNSSGEELPREEWATERFIVDRSVPATVTALAVIPTPLQPLVSTVRWQQPEEPAADVAGVSYEVSLDLGAPIVTRETSCVIDLPDLRGHVVRVRAVDDAGNVGPFATRSFGDSRPPTSSVQPVDSDWVRGPVTLTVKAVDSGTGVRATHVQLNGVEQAAFDTTLTISAEGTTVVSYWSEDVAGNVEATRSVQVRIDDTAPSTRHDVQPSYEGSATITLLPEDGLSGVASSEWRLDDAEAWTAGTVVRAAGVGQHTLRFRSTDHAGNTEDTRTVTFRIGPRMASIAGASRIDTAIHASQEAFPAGARAVVIATAYNYPDALGGSSLAGALDAPLLLTNKDDLPETVVTEIARLGARRAYVLGSEQAVTARVAARVAQAVGGPSAVTRVGGAGRYETAALIASETVAVIKANGGVFEGKVFVATGENFPDALAASPFAAAKARPILLTRGVALPEATADMLERLDVKAATILGSDRAVSDGVKAAIAARVPVVSRLEGAGRYQTAIAVARAAVSEGMTWDGVALATGTNYPDALAGGVMCGRLGSVMLLTDPLTLTPDVRSELASHREAVGTVRFLGSEKALSPGVRAAVREVLQ